MIKKVVRFLTSMELMGVLTLIFAFAIGFATIIERDSGTEAAKAVVYNHIWFEILLTLVSINLIGNMLNYKMFTKKKFTVMMFHIGFIFILIGAGFTRFVGFEGTMSLREGEESNAFLSAKTYVDLKVENGNEVYEHKQDVIYTAATGADYSHNANLGNIKVELTNFIPNAVKLLEKDPNGVPVMSLAVSDFTGRTDIIVQNGEEAIVTGQRFRLNHANPDTMAINFHSTDSSFYVISPFRTTLMQMMAGTTDTVPENTFIPMLDGYIYETGGFRMVLRDFYENGRIVYRSSPDVTVTYYDVFNFNISDGTNSKDLLVKGKKGFPMMYESVNIGSYDVTVGYGAKELFLPFKIRLDDFILERYPGSESPSSYMSKVHVVADNETFPYDIYMNHILNYEGYRFFQASYDTDEKGTILTVNYDAWGTLVTYIGYFLMILGMILAIFSPSSRFRSLVRRAHELAVERRNLMILILLGFGMMMPMAEVQAQVEDAKYNITTYPEIGHAEAFGNLWVQDPQGRFEPMNTLTSEVVRKMTRKEVFAGLTHQQVFLGIMVDPVNWSQSKVLKVGSKEIMELLNQEGKYVSYTDLLDENNNSYRLRTQVEEAYAKEPAKRSKFDKEVMKLNERMNIFYSLVTGQFVRLFPTPGDSTAAWYSGFEQDIYMAKEDSLFVKNIMPLYFNAVREGISTANYTSAAGFLKAINDYQKKYDNVTRGDKAKNLETLYNELEIFKKAGRLYLLVGGIFLLILFIGVLRPKFKAIWIQRIFAALIVIAFLAHTYGLGLRWYISGHAPWSDGYESLVFIAWGAVLAGLVFSRKTFVALAATSVVAAMALSVANLAFMDPEVTNLVPVLKSYWLSIHVSVITLSYAFLGLGAILGLFNLMLYVFLNKKNIKNVSLSVEHITYIIEMTLIVGLYLLTIGTFLGGIWANESWGRYWGWDPKETWSLVTILVYSFVVHMRMIPGLNNKFLFNLLSLLSFASVMMTYFGVNYLLAGLHSYAKGDPAPIPDYVWYTLVVIGIIAAFAGFRKAKFKVKG